MPDAHALPVCRTLHAAVPGERELTVETLWKIPRVGAPVPSPDGKWVAVTVTTYDMEENKGRSRIWLVPADGAGGEPRALTAAAADSSEPAFSPDGRRVAFVRKSGEKEKRRGQIHVVAVDGGEAEPLTDMPLGASTPLWMPDGSGIVFAAKLVKGHLTLDATRKEVERREKDPVKAHVTEDRVYRYWDHWLTTGEVMHLFFVPGTPATDAQPRDLIPDSELWFGEMEAMRPWDVSPDGAEIALSAAYVEKPREWLRDAVFLIPFAGGAMKDVTSHLRQDAFGPRYTPDGRSLLYGWKQDPTFYADRVRLASIGRAGGDHTDVLADWDRSPETWQPQRDGSIVLTAQDDAATRIFRLADGGDPLRLTGDGSAGSPRAGPDGRLHFTMQTLSRPSEAFVVDASGADAVQLTHFTDDAMRGVRLGEVLDVRFEGAYRETVQMFVALPPGHERGRPLPLVHVIHGGPHGISADAFHPRWNAQLFAAPGYVAAMVNFQGSTSWGQDFAKRIQGGWGDRPYLDVMAATDALVEMGLADPDRMAAAGGSYGGYMAAWIATQTTRFRCIVNHAGVFDLSAQYASDITQGRAASFGGEPWTENEKIDRWSPSRWTGGMETPMLVIHGERDYRVPIDQGLECYNMLKAKGVPARLVYFPDENHWVLAPQNSRLWYREVHAWLARHLGA